MKCQENVIKREIQMLEKREHLRKITLYTVNVKINDPNLRVQGLKINNEPTPSYPSKSIPDFWSITLTRTLSCH